MHTRTQESVHSQVFLLRFGSNRCLTSLKRFKEGMMGGKHEWHNPEKNKGSLQAISRR